MKTLLFFLAIGFSLCTAGKAQTSLVSTREDQLLRRYLYILPTFRWHWFTRPQFSLYSSAGLGAYFLRNSFGGDTYHKKEFAYQFSFLGIEYGNQFAFFTEFGVGYTGTIVAGGRFRF